MLHFAACDRRRRGRRRLGEMYPVMLDVADRSCLVVGGGGIALRKAQGLVEEGAHVTVIAPEVVDPLVKMAEDGRLSLERRAYEPVKRSPTRWSSPRPMIARSMHGCSPTRMTRAFGSTSPTTRSCARFTCLGGSARPAATRHRVGRRGAVRRPSAAPTPGTSFRRRVG